jgi:Cof subfamily protein (haloacid dehalogenase superfamily)
MIRLIALDLDGTLLDSRGRVPPANLDAIRDAIGAGVHVVVVTGRTYHFASLVTRQLPEEVVLILNNGAAVKTWDGQSLLTRPLPMDLATAVLSHTLEFRGDTGVVFDRHDGRQIVFESVDLEHPTRKAYFERNHHVISVIVPLEDAINEDPLAIVFNGSVSRMDALATSLRGFARHTPIAMALTSYAHRDFSLIDVMASGTSKGTTLAAWAGRLGIGPAETLAIGDNYNDTDMLAWSGVPVIMGNATEELRTRGWHLTATNDACGVAEAIRVLCLSPRSSPTPSADDAELSQ